MPDAARTGPYLSSSGCTHLYGVISRASVRPGGGVMGPCTAPINDRADDSAALFRNDSADFGLNLRSYAWQR